MKTVKLGDVCGILSGFAFKSSGFGEKGTPIIRIRDVVRGFTETLYDGEFDSDFIIENGDILIGMDGDFNLAKWNGGQALLNQRVCKLEVDENKYSKEFLYYFLPTKLLKIWNDTPFVTVKHLSVKKIIDIDIPDLLLSTQKQIAAILEKADQLCKDCQQMEQELNNLAQAVFIDMFGDPVSNPKGWKSASIKSISNKFNDGPFGSNLKTSHYQNEGVQVIRLTNIGSGYFKNDSQAFVSEEHAKTLEKFKCYPGDIVIATLGDPNLRACIIPEEVPVAINKADCVCCVPNAEFVRAEYLVEYLNLPFTLQSIQNMLHGQTRTRISSGQLGQVKILVPPLKKQDEFLKLIKVRNAELSRHKYLHIEIDELFNSLIQQAFNGELKLKHQTA